MCLLSQFLVDVVVVVDFAAGNLMQTFVLSASWSWSFRLIEWYTLVVDTPQVLVR